VATGSLKRAGRAEPTFALETGSMSTMSGFGMSAKVAVRRYPRFPYEA